MIPTQTIYSTGGGLTVIYSPWFPRGGDYAQVFVQVPGMSSASADLVFGVQLFHKNADETGDGTAVAASVQIPANLLASTTLFHWEIEEPFKEMARYAFGLIDGSGSGSTANWARFRVLPAVWRSKI